MDEEYLIEPLEITKDDLRDTLSSSFKQLKKSEIVEYVTELISEISTDLDYKSIIDLCEALDDQIYR